MELLCIPQEQGREIGAVPSDGIGVEPFNGCHWRRQVSFWKADLSHRLFFIIRQNAKHNCGDQISMATLGRVSGIGRMKAHGS